MENLGRLWPVMALLTVLMCFVTLTMNIVFGSASMWYALSMTITGYMLIAAFGVLALSVLSEIANRSH